MSDEPTRTLPDGLSFEERVLASLSAIDARLNDILAEILEVKEGLGDVGRKIDVLSRDIVQVRADQARVEGRMDKLESKPVQ